MKTGASRPQPPLRQGRRPWRGERLAGLAIAVAVLAVVGWQLPLRELSPVAVVPVAVVMLCALVPRTAVSLACGAIFGAWAGAAWALSAALIAATITYALGHWAGREMLLAKAGPRITALDGWLARRGLLAVVVVRLLPIAPFGLVGYAYGASSVRFRDFLGGTALGGAPSSISYATIGAAAVAPESMSWLTFLPATVGVLISTTAALYWRHTTRAQAHLSR
ncbi:TVP38/TMEM64 family protein [Allorhizocola rhizosphaerae]|uniref:TVP38/TMEM64 family protein n=1 Tax=Allorhizocola rhizosphaerae TaxID=1872709 RepID=UPI0013C2A990|nr:VTT domain-containing protein [Allorhizocola rhizosphaerae]